MDKMIKENIKSNPVGLFDFNNYEEIVDSISDTLGISKTEVRERLFYEAIQSGWNISRAAKKFGLTPHVYNEEMEEFYKKTEGFIFELAVSHLTPECKEIDNRVLAVIDKYYGRRRDLKILSLGDGIGSDTIRFASLGYKAYYFEFDGYTKKYAQYRFKKSGLSQNISVIPDADNISSEYFDIVVCREVLEHVKNPQNMIEDIWNYLCINGIAIITESFSRVDDCFPTHLRDNLQYSDKTKYMFVDAGFEFLKPYPQSRPLIFRKTDKNDSTRFRSLRQDEISNFQFQNFCRNLGRKLLSHIKF